MAAEAGDAADLGASSLLQMVHVGHELHLYAVGR